MKKNDLGKTPLARLAVSYILPSILGMLFLSLQSIIDGLFVAQFTGENALASLNIVMPLIQIISAVSLVTCVGARSLIAIRLGEEQPERAQDHFRTALFGVLAMSLVLMTVCASAAEPLARLLGASDALVADSATYLRTVAFFMPAVSLWFLFDYGLRILGKPARCFLVMGLSCAVNIILDYVFLSVCGMGIFGAALATGLSYLAAGLAIGAPYLKRSAPLNVYRGKFRLRDLGRMLYNGSSEGINALCGAVVTLIFNLILMKYAGEAGVAAYTAMLYIMQIGYCVLSGISEGMGPIVSYNYGAGNAARLRRVLVLEAALAVAAGGLLLTVMLVFGRPLALLFVSSEQAVALAVGGTRIVAFSFLMNGFNILASGYYTSIDYAKESVVIALLRGFVFLVIGILLLPNFFGIDGVWASLVFSEAATLAVVAVMFGYHFKKRALFEKKDAPNVQTMESKE